MFIRKMKRRCMMRGCKNVDTFALSLKSEPGGTVILCRDCLEKAFNAAENFSGNKPAVKTAPPPLFYHDAVLTGMAEEKVLSAAPDENAQMPEAQSLEDADILTEGGADASAAEPDEKKTAAKRKTRLRVV